MFELKLDTDNAAFEEDPKGEIANILAEIANILAGLSTAFWTGAPLDPGFWHSLKDNTGNTIGAFRYLDEANAWRANK